MTRSLLLTNSPGKPCKILQNSLLSLSFVLNTCALGKSFKILIAPPEMYRAVHIPVSLLILVIHDYSAPPLYKLDLVFWMPLANWKHINYYYYRSFSFSGDQVNISRREMDGLKRKIKWHLILWEHLKDRSDMWVVRPKAASHGPDEDDQRSAVRVAQN